MAAVLLNQLASFSFLARVYLDCGFLIKKCYTIKLNAFGTLRYPWLIIAAAERSTMLFSCLLATVRGSARVDIERILPFCVSTACVVSYDPKRYIVLDSDPVLALGADLSHYRLRLQSSRF
ncbi:hypothetical protein EVAR_102239_1 [Eumeta japonica]|uniref:Uncharacterized protein n=1 Tax=Eumeta variegata TaxID=151549 RepID=A0A4C1WD25_EUMVA|nr:hypothetical protein EVAR_102239_1 [Eumeta japonica]